jgi:acetylornithine deacetylase/succinyl-diaminopimelate desuccinylase-like protein
MPVQDGAMAALARMLRRLDRERLPVRVTPAARDMLDAMASGTPLPQRLLLRALARPALARPILELMGERARALAPILRNTVSPTILKTTEKFNVIPSEIAVVLDGRMLPSLRPDDLIAEVRDLVGEDVELEVLRYDPGPAEADLGMFDMLARILVEADPGATAVPLLMPGVTDARFFSRLGIQTYGFLPMKLPPGFNFLQTVHAADERIPAEAVEFGADAIHTALERYAEVR